MDVIVNDENYKRKLIFTNTKNQKNGAIYSKILIEVKERAATRNEPVPYTAVQLRTKFKKLVGECKRAALTIKTATGIKRFQDNKGYGQWFDQLFALIKTRDSCQPDQAIEPSASTSTSGRSSSNTDLEESSRSEAGDAKLFVPVKRNKKAKKIGPIEEAVNVIKHALENDPVKDLLAFMKEEAEKSRQHDLMLMQMLQPVPQQTFPHPTPQSPQPQGSHAMYLPPNMHAMFPPNNVVNTRYAGTAQPSQPSEVQYSPQRQYYNDKNGQSYHTL